MKEDSPGFLLKWQQQPRLQQAQGRSPEFYLSPSSIAGIQIDMVSSTVSNILISKKLELKAE